MRKLNVDDIRDLARGAAVLGTGGGGDPLIGRLLVEQAISDGFSVEVIGLDELADDAFVISTAMMGAPTVVVEKAPSGEEVLLSLRELEAVHGRRADAIIPMECGGLNSMIPLLTAARAGIPVVDADGMGRAFPELQMQTFGVYGLPGSPMTVSNERGETVLIKSGDDNKQMETLARAITVAMGGVAYIAEFGMSGAQAKRTAVPDTLSLAQEIGVVLRKARTDHSDPFADLVSYLATTPNGYGRTLMAGKVVDVERTILRGWTLGCVTIEAFDTGEIMRIEFRNENLVARVGERVVAIVPDLISILDAETAAPINTESVRYGQRVKVFGIATPPVMRTPEALEVFGPAAFGLAESWVPIESLS